MNNVFVLLFLFITLIEIGCGTQRTVSNIFLLLIITINNLI